jgi:serine/threonine-protein phosphatase 2A regulatory subunit A
MAGVVPVNVIATYIIPLINELERDPIPNIRFNVAKTHQRTSLNSFLILELIPLLKDDPNGISLLNEIVKPSLLRLKDDSDGDVRFYANQAIACF